MKNLLHETLEVSTKVLHSAPEFRAVQQYKGTKAIPKSGSSRIAIH
jgi:hypothetical protein